MTHLQVDNTRKVFKIDHIIQLWLITLSSHVAGWRILTSIRKDFIKNAVQLCSLPLFISCFYIYLMTIWSNAVERISTIYFHIIESIQYFIQLCIKDDLFVYHRWENLLLLPHSGHAKYLYQYTFFWAFNYKMHETKKGLKAH